VSSKEKWIPPHVQALIDAGYGEVTIHEHEGGITTSYHFLSYADMEAMGEEERIRLGVEASYQRHRARQTPKAEGDRL
jgi:hypothetical protein